MRRIQRSHSLLADAMRLVAVVMAALVALAGCDGRKVPPAPLGPEGPPAIPDAQPAVDAPLFIGQNAFATPLGHQTDFSPILATARADGGNSGVVDGPAPLGRAPVTGSATLPLQPPLLWGRRGGLTAGCHIEIAPGLTKNCLASVDASTPQVQAHWLPPGQDLNLATAVLDDSQRIYLTTRQGHLFVVARPASDGSSFRVIRDIDLGAHLGAGQALLGAIADATGNVWFVSGAPPLSGDVGPDTTVGYVTPEDQVVALVLANQRAETGLAVDQAHVFLTTAPTAPAGAADQAGATGSLYDLTATAGAVQIVWQEAYDAGSGPKAGGTTRGSASPVMLLGSQFLAITDNADNQSHLLVFLRGTLPGSPSRGTTTTTTSATPSTSTTTATGPPGAIVPPTTTASTTTTGATSPPTTGATGATGPGPVVDPRLVCHVDLFTAGASAVTSPPVAYSSTGTSSVIIANGLNLPLPLASPTDGGPTNSIVAMAPGVTKIDVMADGSCTQAWTTPLRLKTGPVLSSTTGLVYGYTQDEARAATGSYVWYFVALDYRSGRVMWRQRVGAGPTKNDNRQPLFLGANGVLYQTVPLGLLWMRDVAQKP